MGESKTVRRALVTVAVAFTGALVWTQGAMSTAQDDIRRVQERQNRLAAQDRAAMERGAALTTDKENKEADADLRSAWRQADRIHEWQGEILWGLVGLVFLLFVFGKKARPAGPPASQ